MKSLLRTSTSPSLFTLTAICNSAFPCCLRAVIYCSQLIHVSSQSSHYLHYLSIPFLRILEVHFSKYIQQLQILMINNSRNRSLNCCVDLCTQPLVVTFGLLILSFVCIPLHHINESEAQEKVLAIISFELYQLFG